MTENPRIAMAYDAPYLQNEFGDPDFFTFLITAVKVFKTFVRGKVWARTSLTLHGKSTKAHIPHYIMRVSYILPVIRVHCAFITRHNHFSTCASNPNEIQPLYSVARAPLSSCNHSIDLITIQYSGASHAELKSNGY